MTRCVMTAVLALVLARGAAADGGIVLLKNVEEAKKAAAGKKPIAVLLTQKGCPASAELAKNLSKDARIGELGGQFAWVHVQVGTAEYKDWFVKTCGGNVEGTPAIVFLNPKGENADPEYAGVPAVASADPDDVVPVLRDVLQRAKVEEPEADKAAVTTAMEGAKSAKTAGERIAAWRGAIRAGDGWRGEAEKVEQARAGIEEELQKGGAEMLRILREVRDAEGQRAAYEKVKVEFAGTPVADWAAEEAAKVKVPRK